MLFRSEVHGRFSRDGGDFLLVDDYGHHPSEVKAMIEAVRKSWPDARLVMVYQPHRYSRTLELFDQFVDVLAKVDKLILLNTYAAGEAEIAGASGADLFKQLQLTTDADVTFMETLHDVPAFLEQEIRAGDIVITQGAGETASLASGLKQRWDDRRVADV